MNLRDFAQTLTISLAAIATSLVLFGILLVPYEYFVNGKSLSPFEIYHLMYVGGFGSSFSWTNTLSKAAPLILTALCTALPARVGLIIIGGEGALVLGGLGAAAVGVWLQEAPPVVIQIAMALAGMTLGALIIMIAGAARYFRGINETIASLLLTYIAIAIFNYLVEGVLRDPASLNKPSTFPIPVDAMLGNIFGLDIKWGLAFGILFCVASYLLMFHTTFGFAANMVGGNMRAALASGLPVAQILLICCALGGAAAGLAGMVEIAGVHGQANANLIAGYGFTGILVSFMARHHPLGIIPVAILFGGLAACSGLLQRRLQLNDATVQVLMGLLFLLILFFETLYGRLRIFEPREVREVALAK